MLSQEACASGSVITRAAQIGPTGSFSLNSVPANSYTVWIKSSKWLAKNVSVGPGNTVITTLLLTGDATADNSVDSSDFGALISVYDSDRTLPGSGYDPAADFNCDGLVDSSDFSLLIGNFNTAGDSLAGSSPPFKGSIIWDLPAPDYGESVVPLDGANAGGAVNLTSGVYENHPGADLSAFNPVGASPAYVRTYHSGRASQGYGSPGLSPGWIDNYDYTLFAPPTNTGGYGPLALIYPNGAIDVITTPAQPVAAASPATVLSGGDCLLNPPAQVPYFATGKIGAQGIWTAIYITFADNRQMVFTPDATISGLYRYTALWDLKHDAGALGRALTIARNANGSVASISNDRPVASTLLQFSCAGGASGNLTWVKDVTDANNLRSVQYDWSGGQLYNVYQINEAASTGHFLWQYAYQPAHAAAPGSLWTLLSTITVPKPNPNMASLPVTTMTYDNLGRVQSVADANSNTRQYAYGPGSTTVTVPTGVANAADGAASQSWTQHFSRNLDTGTSQAYTDAAGAAVSINTSVVYTEINPYLVSAMVDQNGAKTDYTYDGATGNLLTVKAPVNGGIVTTAYTYNNANTTVNPLGWLTRIDASSNSGGGAAKIPTTFDYYTTTTPNGLRGQISAIHTPQPGQTYPGSLPDYSAYQVTASFTYTALGNLLSITSPGPNSVAVGAGKEGTVTTTFNYTSDTFTNYFNDGAALTTSEVLGQPLTVTSPFETAANPAGTRTQHYRYDTRGNVRATISDSGTIRSDYEYNDANQPKSSAAPRLSQLGTADTRLTSIVQYAYLGGPALSVACYAYPIDGNGMPAPQPGMLPLRQVTTEYGAAQEVKSVTGSTAPVSLSYDKAYQMAGLADGSNHASQFKYDGGGNLFQHKWPGGAIVGMAYDSKGNLDSATSARQTKAKLAYSLDHTVVTGIHYTNGLDANLVLPDALTIYDGFGRVETSGDNTTALTYAYDDNDNVLSVITRYTPAVAGQNDAPLTQQVVYTYNTDGTIGETQWFSGPPPPQAAFAPTSGVVLASSRPAVHKRQGNRQAWIDATDPMRRGCFPSGDTQTVYPIPPLGPVGQPVSQWDPFTEQSSATYDPDGHLTNASNDALKTSHGFCGPCLAASLTYDGVDCAFLRGNLAALCLQQMTAFPQARAAASPLPQFVNYRYDPLNNLKEYQTRYDSAGRTFSTTYGYDEDNQRDRLRSEAYGELAAGNDPAQPPQFQAQFTNTYVPDAADNLITLRGAAGFTFNPDNQLAGGANAYDADGNQTGTGAAAMTYDAANRMTSYDCGNVHLTFGYRPDGLRAWKATNGGPRTYYFYDGSRLQFELTQQTDGSWATTRYFAWGANGLYESWTPAEGRIAYLFDPQGSAVSRYTERGANPGVWSSTEVYDAYGQVRQYDATNALSDPVGYNGQSGYYTDVPSLAANGTQNAQPGLILCSHRYYSPDLARWLTRDPIGYEGGINVYAYCGNNPVGHIDPSGLKFLLPTDPYERRDFYVALWYLLRDPDFRKIIVDLWNSSVVFTIQMNNNLDTKYDRATNTIHWDPDAALKISERRRLTPALGLGHELAHAWGWEHGFTDRSDDAQYTNVEERRVITRIERKFAKRWGESIRYAYEGELVMVCGPLDRWH